MQITFEMKFLDLTWNLAYKDNFFYILALKNVKTFFL